jgi:hypothetical protein
MMPLSLIVASTFVMFTVPLKMLLAFESVFFLLQNNLIYVSRRLNFMIKCLVAICAFSFLIITTTNVGVPYKYSETSPRVRRIIALVSAHLKDEER